MAITVLQSPDDFQPVYNPIDWLVSSDKTGQSNFLYICDIYITGVSTPAYVRLKRNADPTTGYANFDIHRVIESYVTSDISTASQGFVTNDNSYVEYQVKFGEEYGSSSTGTTVYSNLSVQSTKYAWNAVFDMLEFQNYDQADYIPAATGDPWPQLLTNMPSSVNIRSNENAWLYSLNNTSGTTHLMRITTYNSTGGIIQQGYFNNQTIQAANTDARHFFRVGVGTYNLNNTTQPTLFTMTQPIITASVAYYEVFLGNWGATETSEQKTFVIDDTCTNHDTYRLHFLNKLGGYDSFTFIRLSRQTMNIRRENYKKALGTISGSTYGYAKSDRQDTQFDTNIKDSVTVSSDWITDAESVWLQELLTSPSVYLDDATHGLIAINITNSSYETRKAVNDKVFNLVITFEYTYNRKRQRA